MQARLIPKMLNPLDKAFFALALDDLFRTQSDLGCAAGGACKNISRQNIDPWQSKAACRIDTDRIFIDLARCPELLTRSSLVHM